MKARSWTDQRVDNLIGGILQAGVMAAGILVFAGGILYLIHYGAQPVHYQVFGADRTALSGVLPLLRGAAHLDSRAIIQLGILLLIATPVVRVAFSVVAFWLQRDRIYVAFTLVVLGILLYSLFG